jgi:hypothetical protein
MKSSRRDCHLLTPSRDVGFAAAPALLEVIESLAVELRDAGGSDSENSGNVAQGDVLEVVEDDDRGLGFRQIANALEEDAAVLGTENGMVGPLAMGVGKAFGEGEALLAVEVFAYFVERNKLAVLEGSELAGLDTESIGEFSVGGLAVELDDKLVGHVRNTPSALMNGTWCPVPSA